MGTDLVNDTFIIPFEEAMNRMDTKTLIEKACEITGTTVEAFYKKNRKNEIVNAKRLVINRLHGKKSLNEIGEIVNLDHATVLYHYKKSLDLIMFDKKFIGYNNILQPSSWTD